MRKKLIEVALPLQAISEHSAREKSLRHGHPSTLHLWWARRPLASVRAVLWASLVDDPSAHPDKFPSEEDQRLERKRLFGILERLVVWENSSDPDVLAEARAEIEASCGGGLPNMLDPFGGGGHLLEAQRLGLPTYGGDLNPVAVLLGKAMVEIPGRFSGRPPVNPQARGDSNLEAWVGAQGLAEDVRFYGEWMREQAWERIGNFYPKVPLPEEKGGGEGTVIAWLWARTVQSPDPAWDGHVPLLKAGILRKREGKQVVWVEPVVDRSKRAIGYRVREGGAPPGGTMKRGGAVCAATGATISLDYVKQQAQQGLLGRDLIGLVVEGSRGRVYVDSPVGLPEAPAVTWKPSGKLVGKATDQVPSYGMTEWADLFIDRQLLALTTFSDLLQEVRGLVVEHAKATGWTDDGVRLRDGSSGVEAYADAVVTYLALVVDRCASYWTSLSYWHNTREIVVGMFGRQAISMVWDFAEANPFSSSSGNWLGQVEWVAKVLSRLPASSVGEVGQRDAVARLGEVEAPLVCTDPPYYDNIQYADLSDFFYVWLRPNLREVWPDELATRATPKAEELVANHWRAGSRRDAKEHFESGMAQVMDHVAQVQNPDFPATIFYAFKQQETRHGQTVSTGWETFLQGLVDAGLQITATWPLRTEMAVRMLARGTAALASSVVIACRRRPEDARMETRGGFMAALRAELPEAIRLLREQNIAPVDMAQSAIGPGMEVFSRYERVVEAAGDKMRVRTALALINEVLEEIQSAEETELDSDSRFALTWFRQYGHQAGPFGDAETLSKAMNTSVDGVVSAGIASLQGGKLRLLTRQELDPEWAPREDKRRTDWEAVQHLVRRLDDSESHAANLLRQLGGLGDQAHQLAYLLYQEAERRGDTDEAVAYNGLIMAWPTLLAQAQTPSADQEALL